MAKKFIDLKGLSRITANFKAYVKALLLSKADVDLGNVEAAAVQALMGEASIVTTAGTGAAYTADVPGITELRPGVSFTMIPHITSSTTAPTLNVNGLGVKNLRQPLTTNTAGTTTAAVQTWLSAGHPVRVMYNGTLWEIDIPRPSAASLYGKVPIESGGTDAATAEEALVNLGAQPAIGSGSVAVSANRTLAATDAGKFLCVDGAATITIPAGVLPVGAEIEVFRNTSEAVTIAAASGVSFAIPGNAELLTESQQISDQYASVVLKQISANVWSVQGAV